jgi:ribosomal protein L6P/L9E
MAPFNQVIIIRGIGYRIYVVQNDFKVADNLILNNYSNIDLLYNIIAYEFPYYRYLIIRAGHASDLYLPIPKTLLLKISKRDRKAVFISNDKLSLGYFVSNIIKYRSPSIYTGRGIRVKHKIQFKKAGKKDKQKGKTF